MVLPQKCGWLIKTFFKSGVLMSCC